MIRIWIIAVVTCLMATASAQELKAVPYKDGTQKLNGLVTSNSGIKAPGVLILPAWKGIDEEAKTAALALQKAGYIAFIADIYGEGNIPADNAAAAKIADSYKTNYKKYQERIAAALQQLKAAGADPNKIAVIGFCFGGTGALEAARAKMSVNGIVSIHGGLAKDSSRQLSPITTKVLVENPAEDKSVTQQGMQQFVNEMNQAKADWQIITYAGCKHTFTDPLSPDYNELMAKRAWQHTLLFLDEVLK